MVSSLSCQVRSLIALSARIVHLISRLFFFLNWMALAHCVTLDEKGWISCLRLNWSWNSCCNIPTLESLQGCLRRVNRGCSFRFGSYFSCVRCGYRFALPLASVQILLSGCWPGLAWVCAVVGKTLGQACVSSLGQCCFLTFRRSSEDEPWRAFEAVMPGYKWACKHWRE